MKNDLDIVEIYLMMMTRSFCGLNERNEKKKWEEKMGKRWVGRMRYCRGMWNLVCVDNRTTTWVQLT